MFYTIYKTINVVNGKFYIGKHQTKDLNDDYLGSGKLLKHAIKKYGVDNFHKEILHICKDEDHMNLLESILVVPDTEINYNLCEGGKGGWGYLNKTGLNNLGKDYSFIGQKIAKSLRGRKNPHTSKMLKDRHDAGLVKYGTWKNKNLSEDHKQKISEAMSLKKGKETSQYGTCWITNGIENRKIKKEKLDSWLELGYNKGRKFQQRVRESGFIP